jgi:hypothetical protein
VIELVSHPVSTTNVHVTRMRPIMVLHDRTRSHATRAVGVRQACHFGSNFMHKLRLALQHTTFSRLVSGSPRLWRIAAATTPLRRDVTEHLLDVSSAPGERRFSTLPTSHSLAHAPLLLTMVRGERHLTFFGCPNNGGPILLRPPDFGRSPVRALLVLSLCRSRRIRPGMRRRRRRRARDSMGHQVPPSAAERLPDDQGSA